MKNSYQTLTHVTNWYQIITCMKNWNLIVTGDSDKTVKNWNRMQNAADFFFFFLGGGGGWGVFYQCEAYAYAK